MSKIIQQISRIGAPKDMCLDVPPFLSYFLIFANTSGRVVRRAYVLQGP